MLFKNYIDDFLLVKEIEEGCSPNTIKAYRYDLIMFISDLSTDVDISTINQFHIRSFLKKLKDREYSKVAIARKIACLRSFFEYLEASEIIKLNPMKKINSPRIKTEEHLPKFLTVVEMKNIIEFVQNDNKLNYTTSKRIYIIIRLLYATMARVSEISNARVGDVDFSNGLIRLRGKGNKERIVPVDKQTLKILREYLMERIFFKNEDPLLINKSGGALSVRSIQRDIHLLKIKMGYTKKKKLTPHIFRHTGATHLRQAGMDISELQDILGHSNPNTTRIYAKNDINRIKEVYRDKHPLYDLERE
ncbi:MAG: tyrosine-type recombinase/integrase [Candidatus Lokiarchaeota archaeon]|nr:tyrosine-type recombinase/integrase [Candidatus Lokiarchaeota archaeon]